jgi:hypothetical protein
MKETIKLFIFSTKIFTTAVNAIRRGQTMVESMKNKVVRLNSGNKRSQKILKVDIDQPPVNNRPRFRSEKKIEQLPKIENSIPFFVFDDMKSSMFFRKNSNDEHGS